MPIYEYYCSACDGRFRHLARRIDEAPPPCPRCGHTSVERLVSAANMIHGSAHHRDQLREGASHVDGTDPQAAAEFLKESGRLEDASGLYGSRAYRELIERRVAGASDNDLTDLIDDLAAEVQPSTVTEVASALVLSEQVENRMRAEHPPEDHEGGHPDGMSSSNHASKGQRSRGGAEDLGWG